MELIKPNQANKELSVAEKCALEINEILLKHKCEFKFNTKLMIVEMEKKDANL